MIDDLLVGESPPMAKLKRLIHQLGPSGLPVLIEGETGSGKELVAKALHDAAASSGPFVPVNVCAIPETVFEAALFGHVRGAFTGALSDAPGYLAEAHCGTLFLDEIGSLPWQLQPKLLRAIETGEYRQVGGRSDRHSAFRVVAATNERLDDLLACGRFRPDLAYRLAAATIRVPALRDRLEDVPALVRAFAASAGAEKWFQADAMDHLRTRPWPGNVRQLRNVVLQALATSPGAAISCAELPADVTPTGRAESERTRLLTMLSKVDWDLETAAREEGVHRSTLYRRLRRHGIPTHSTRAGSVAGASCQA